MPEQTDVSDDPREARRKKTARTKQINNAIDGLLEVARIVAEKASRTELYAAKNQKAGFDRGAERKEKDAAHLRRMAAFLADPHLHDLIRKDERLVGMLLGEVDIVSRPGWNYLAPRKIDMETVKPSRKWPTRFYGDYSEFGN